MKYNKHNKNSKRYRGFDIQKDKIVITESEPVGTDKSEYLCHRCEQILTALDRETGSYRCNNCAIETFVNEEPTRRKSKLSTPRPKNTETLISHVPTLGFNDVKIKHEPELKGGFLALSKKGTIRFTSYDEHNP